MRTWLHDLRHAARSLRRAPAYTAAVVLTLGLGVGANAAMFGVVDRLMLRPLPYLRDPGAVHRVYLQTTGRGRELTLHEFPYTRYLDLARGTSSFTQTAAVAQRALAVGDGDRAREHEVAGVSASLFAFFDARPVRGRFFGASEDVVPDGAPVVVLAARYWRDAFGGADVVGRTLRVGTLRCTIVGVAPDDFVGAPIGDAPDAFIPITAFPRAAGENKADSYARLYNWDWASMLVRRRAGVSSDAATADLTRAFVASRRAQRVQMPGMSSDDVARPRAIAAAVRPAAGPGAGLESRTLLWVGGVAVIVLVIACANVTNLALARALRARRDTAVRLALGVTPARLVSRAVAEGVWLATLGGGAGVLIAQWGGAALRALVLPASARASVVTDARTLLACAACALVAGLATSVVPALLGLRTAVAPTLRADARSGTRVRSRARSSLVVAQVALSAALLVGAALFVRSLEHVRATRLGYDAESVLVVEPDFRGTTLDSAQRAAAGRRLLAAAQGVPGVRAAARVNSRVFASNTRPLFVDGVDSVSALGRFNMQLGSVDYFAATGTRILRGRGFTESDREGAPPVAVVSENAARRLWPGRDALGQCLRVEAADAPCTTVVGVAEGAAEYSITDTQRLVYYLPLEQIDPSWGRRMYVRVRGADVDARAEEVRRAVQRAMPGDGYVVVRSMRSLVDEQRRSWTLGATMFVAFGALALLVAAVGLYGVVAYDVAQRTHEMGVRMALGARAPDVARLVVGEGVAFALGGVACGLGLALVAARWVQPLLFESRAVDPLVYSAVALAMLLVAAVASYVPARRATRTEPTVALRG